MKVTIMLYKDRYAGHIGLLAVDSQINEYYTIHFVHDVRADIASYFAPISDSITFDTTRTMAELKEWHQQSKYYHQHDYNLLTNNCAHAVRDVMEQFFGYDMIASNSCFFTPIFFGCGAFTRLPTPRSIFLTTQRVVAPQTAKSCYLSGHSL